MVRGWRKATFGSRSKPVRLMMPVDVRSRLGLGQELLLAISTTNQVVVPEQSQNFWALARSMRVEAKKALTDHMLLLTAAGRAAGIQSTKNKEELDAISEEHLAWDLLVSNLGVWKPGYEGKTLQLTDVWGPAALYGFRGERGIGTVTFAGELRILLASRENASGLLEAICSELREAAV
jgi:hypothetical protein